MIVHDHASLSIEKFSARRRHRHFLNAISFRQLAIGLVIPYLQREETDQQEYEHTKRRVLKYRDSAERKPSVIPEQTSGMRRGCAFFFRMLWSCRVHRSLPLSRKL